VSSAETVPVEIDGELIGNCPVEFEIRAGGLHVFAPE
jgi:diacylglycerol kinase family enzyme